MPDPRTEELRIDQIQREREEKDAADTAEKPADRLAHARRAEKAAYLKSKLAERARAEDERAKG